MTAQSRPRGAHEPSRTRPLRSRRTVVAVFLALAGLAVPLAPPGAAAEAPAAAANTGLRQLARDLVAAGAPGVIVRVDDGTGPPVEITEQAPWAAKEYRLRADDEFRMGSNTKTMIATLVLQLVAEGRLDLADPVEKWLPGRVPDGRAITLRMLLNHTSGLFDYTEDTAVLPSLLGKDRRRWTPTRLLALGVRHDPLFAPGTKWSYSNTNYAAIGAVLEKATGEGLAELVRDRIARPLGLRHTYYATDGAWRGPHARGHEPDAAHMPPGVPAAFREYAGTPREGHVDVSDNSPSWGGPAGAVVSTARDWARFHTALMSGGLLPAAQLAQLRTTVPMSPDEPDGPGYGLGIMTLKTPCGTVWAHDGGIPGYLSTTLTDATGSRTAAVLVATEAFAEHPDAFPEITRAARTLQSATLCAMLGEPAPAPSAGTG
ncbi:serine hydrolase domain-containing protein [Streptomyces sp. NPDC052114]|uniref:serine hydrolase domain-containing protein n=1 Tax=unclassified Streptomyces TaxID=2593676 RepID=UPI003430156A